MTPARDLGDGDPCPQDSEHGRMYTFRWCLAVPLVQLQVAAIEVDGILDELAAVVSRLPAELGSQGVAALAWLETLRDAIVSAAENRTGP